MQIFFNLPEFFPPLSFFYALANSDLWVVIDHLPFKARTRQNRCRLKVDVSIQPIIVPVRMPTNRPVCEITINNFTGWKRTFLKTIERGYGNTDYYSLFIDDLKHWIHGPTIMLETLNVQTTLWVAGLLKLHPTLFYTRQLYLRHLSKRTIVKTLCAKFSGERFSKNFEREGDKDLSILHTLFTVGAEETRRMIT